MTEIHQAPFQPDIIYEAATLNLYPDDTQQMLGLTIETPEGGRVLIGINSVQMFVLANQIRDAQQVLPNLRKWQPFRPA